MVAVCCCYYCTVVFSFYVAVSVWLLLPLSLFIAVAVIGRCLLPLMLLVVVCCCCC